VLYCFQHAAPHRRPTLRGQSEFHERRGSLKILRLLSAVSIYSSIITLAGTLQRSRSDLAALTNIPEYLLFIYLCICPYFYLFII